MSKVNRTVLHDSVPTVQYFKDGGTVRTTNDLFIDGSGSAWRYTGTVPIDVPAGTVPTADTSWNILGDSVLRSDLNDPNGYKHVGGLSTLYNPYNFEISNVTDTPLDSAYTLGNKPTNILRFATNNLWTYYSTDKWFGGDPASPEKAMQLKKLWLKVSADVWGFQEVFTSPTKDISMFLIPPYKSAYFTPANKVVSGFKYGTACMSRVPVTEHVSGTFNSEPSTLDHEYRVYDMLFLQNGVLFINTHLSTDPSRTTKMLVELAEIVTSSGINKVVIVGDMNTRKLEDFKPLEDIGFTLINKGVWTDIDKILVRGVKVVGTGMEKILGGSPWQHLSDHDLYYVDVEV